MMHFLFCFILAAATDWPLRYNEGVTAYRSNDFAAAATAFEQALAAPDRTLQQRALYNLGNASYRLGELQPQQAQQYWQRAVKLYESALALNSQDADARFNLEFVKKKLEQLQQQQQQQDKQNQPANKQDQKQDQKKDDQKQEQQNQQSQQQQQDQQQQQQKQDQQQQRQAQDQKSKEQQQQQQQQQAQSQSDKLDKQQARALLDQLRENEQHWNFFPEVQMKDLKPQGPPAKDW